MRLLSLLPLALTSCLVVCGQLRAQNVRKVTGTGQTTGHIAVLTIENKSNKTYHVVPQKFYIPSGGQYQPYVGSIPEGIVVPPQNTITVPVNGYCADVSKPPVPPGEPLPPIETWIPVGIISTLNTPQGTPFVTLPKPPVQPFTPDLIPTITSGPGFQAKPPTVEKPASPITWPGTDIPVTGVFTPEVKPEVLAPVLVEVIDRITKSFEEIKEEKPGLTPFSPDPQREREAVIQQTFWMYTSALEGERYEKPQFTAKVIEQFRTTSGIDTTELPAAQKQELHKGIDQFWSVFQATGVEAKVLSVAPEQVPSIPDQPGQVFSPENPQLISEDVCGCGDVAFQAELKALGMFANETEKFSFTTEQIQVPGTNRRQKQKILESKMMLAEGMEFTFVLKDVKTGCTECKKSKKCDPSDMTITASYGEIDEKNSASSVASASVKSDKGVHTLGGTMPKGDNDVGVFVTIKYQCKGNGCKDNSCEEKFLLRIKRRGLCACDQTLVTLEYDHKKSTAKSKTSEDFSFVTEEYITPMKVSENDVLNVTLSNITGTCSGCDPKCAPSGIKYKVYGENISGLSSVSDAKEKDYKAGAKLVIAKKVTGKEGDAVLYLKVSYDCEHITCLPAVCDKVYSLRFTRE